MNKTYSLMMGGAALVLMSGTITGCSSDTMRFADAFYEDALPGQNNSDERPYNYGAGKARNANSQQQADNTQPAGYPQASYPQQNDYSQNNYPQNSPYPPAPQQGYSSQQPIQSASVYQPPVEEPQPVRKNITTGSSYVVQNGDTLFDISQRSGVSVSELRNANELSDGKIRIGQKLVIPGGASVAPAKTSGAVQVASASQASQAATRTAVQKAEDEGRAATNSIVNDVKPQVQTGVNQTKDAAETTTAVADTKQDVVNVAVSPAVSPPSTGISEMRWPARGRIVSDFGEKAGSTTNDGIDISLPEGSAVKAAENGVVIYAGSGLREFGNTVLIKHEGNVVTVYGHNSDLLVKKGDKVTRGQDIAKSGMSGKVETPRLHFEIRKNSKPVNPKTYLQ